MTPLLPPVLIIDDEKNMRLSLKSILAGEGYNMCLVESAEDALDHLEREEFFMVITDARLGGMSGYDFLAKACKKWPNTPFLMITAYATPKLAVEAIKAGAIDYLAKPFAPEELLHAVSRCAERYNLLRENATLRAHVVAPYQLDQIIGESPKMMELKQLIQSVAPTNASRSLTAFPMTKITPHHTRRPFLATHDSRLATASSMPAHSTQRQPR